MHSHAARGNKENNSSFRQRSRAGIRKMKIQNTGCPTDMSSKLFVGENIGHDKKDVIPAFFWWESMLLNWQRAWFYHAHAERVDSPCEA